MGISFSRGVLGAVAGLALVATLPTSHATADEPQTISTVEVHDDEGVTRIVLRGAEDPIYTAFMREDPPRLIIELPDVVFEGIDTPLRVENGLVNEVTFGAFGDPRVARTMARVSIGLARESEYDVLPGDGELVVELRPTGPGPDGPPVVMAETGFDSEFQDAAVAELPAAADEFAAFDAAQPGAGESLLGETAEDGEAVPDPGAEAVPESASGGPEGARIVEVVATEDGVEVLSEGAVDNVDSFELQDPDRVVVDFWGVRSAVSRSRVDFDSGDVKSVRVGTHPDKVRVVLDMRAPLASHSVIPTARGVRIAVAALAADANAVPAVADEVPASGDEASTDEAFTDEAFTDEASTDEAYADEATVEETEPERDSAADFEPMGGDIPAPEEAAQPAPAIEEASSEPSTGPHSFGRPAGVPVTVESAHFESLPAVDRVVLRTDFQTEATLFEPDPTTLVVTLAASRIARSDERRVDTREFGGPIEMFSVFQTPDVDFDEVRVVLKRRGPIGAALAWDENKLTIALTRPAGAEVPAPPAESFASLPEAPEPLADATSGAESEALGPERPAALALPSGDLPAIVVEREPVPEAGPATPLEPAPVEPTPAAPAPAPPSEKVVEAYGGGLSADPFLDGPADPASIDILEEGGFDEEKAYQGRRISLDFKDAEIGNILRLIAEVSDLNVIAGDEVAGKVTIRLVDVPWDQALDVILLTKGLGFVRVGNVLRIAPIDTLKVEREARLQERRAKEKLEDLVVKLQPVNYAAVSEIADLIERLLSARGSVNVDERTSTLIIKDIPSVIHEATALVKAIDTQTPQVLIEAKIVEASLNFSRSLGAVWGLGYRPLGGTGGAPDFHLGDGTVPIVPGLGGGLQTNNFVASNPVTGALNGLLTLGLLGADDHLQLDLQLQAAEENRKGKVISSPRVVTLDNREATIKQGVAIKFVEVTDDKITTSFVDAVLELKVTPHITANRSIIMKIKVTRNAPQLSAATGEVVGIDKNEAQTEALVRDGETMVLGGIYVVENGNNRSKVPFLADIPLIGSAFSSSVVQDERRELLIFVTPRVVMGPTPDL